MIRRMFARCLPAKAFRFPEEGSALVELAVSLPLLSIMLFSQIVNGELLPFILIFMLLLINKEKLMGSYRNGPVTIGVDQGGGRSLVPWKYTYTDITLTQSWYGTTKGAYPAYGHGAHHTFAHTVVASDDPTTNLYKIKN